jgi:hypothetical protein
VTEAEWLACDDPTPMLEHLRGKAGDRRLRLFACACCRGASKILMGGPEYATLETAERFADGLARAEELARANDADASDLAGLVTEPDGWAAAAATWITFMRIEPLADRDGVRLLRCVFGNPFRPVGFDPAWRSITAVAVANLMYESRDFGALPVLADALQDAGCEHPDVLEHCRSAGEHVRGCWAVDLVLGKG